MVEGLWTIKEILILVSFATATATVIFFIYISRNSLN